MEKKFKLSWTKGLGDIDSFTCPTVMFRYFVMRALTSEAQPLKITSAYLNIEIDLAAMTYTNMLCGISVYAIPSLRTNASSDFLPEALVESPPRRRPLGILLRKRDILSFFLLVCSICVTWLRREMVYFNSFLFLGAGPKCKGHNPSYITHLTVIKDILGQGNGRQPDRIDTGHQKHNSTSVLWRQNIVLKI